MQLELHLIINRHAASGNAAKSADLVLSALDNKQISYKDYSTDYPGHAIDITRELLKTTLTPWPDKKANSRFPLLVILGGDGTLHEVVNALDQHFHIPIAYIPCGSGNDFARGVSLSRDPLMALEHLLEITEPQPYHVLHYLENIQEEEGYATNNIGIGIDAAIVARSNVSASKQTFNKFKLGSLSYLYTAIQVLTKQKGFPLMVEVNGKSVGFDNAFLCTTTNHPYFGGGIAIVPEADVKSKAIDLVVVERIHLLKLFRLIGQLLKRKHMSSPYVHHFKSQNIRIVSTTSQFGQADGEELDSRPFDIQFTTVERLFWL
ncbi:diacylglycerol kinase family lipid kinase [Vagococcus sp. BWB3-3]|uniref:Diacylglycerol kinase family lipid kinase n=1 Tax=Vagococcus allomyrinae TaxID=2794353 RepID=A0A940SU95_9ENTE|nr:diacylglycerol kinase family lipid kinase [Vagococcus allomyrinae]